jgi:Ras family protein T1
MSRSKVTVTVIGDKGVGKTSLITTAAQDCFSRHPPPVLPLTRFSERFFENEPVELLVYDTCSDPHQDPVAFESVVQAADVIVLCFDFQRRETAANLRTHWLPKLCSLKPDTPIILSCCKAETDSPRDQEELREVISHSLGCCDGVSAIKSSTHPHHRSVQTLQLK